MKNFFLIIILGFFWCSYNFAEVKKNRSYYQKLLGLDEESDKVKWDQKFSKTKDYIFGKNPSPYLVENLKYLKVGNALDIAMGEGRNAVFLAKKGFAVTGVDISEVAVKKAKQLAKENKVKINAIVEDLNHYQIKKDFYDVIINFFYLNRNLIPKIKLGLKKNGIVIFETYTVEELKYKKMNKDYLLEKEELKKLFSGFEILHYEEVDTGKEAVARLVAKKIN
jgi:2-polyprenyl-3-methyl-5-hydroxy-6-metoxy-1,4-benzoquinol methylase